MPVLTPCWPTTLSAALPTKVSEILHFLLATSMGPGSGEWFGRLVRTQTAEEKRTDMLMVGDFGNSPDGEKGLIMAVAMRRIGLVGELTVVANLGDARMRARLAKGTLNALGASLPPDLRRLARPLLLEASKAARSSDLLPMLRRLLASVGASLLELWSWLITIKL